MRYAFNFSLLTDEQLMEERKHLFRQLRLLEDELHARTHRPLLAERVDDYTQRRRRMEAPFSA